MKKSIWKVALAVVVGTFIFSVPAVWCDTTPSVPESVKDEQIVGTMKLGDERIPYYNSAVVELHYDIQK